MSAGQTFTYWSGVHSNSGSGNYTITVTTVGSTTYTITYNLNGGTGTTPSAQTVTAGNSIIAASNSGFSRSGFTFAGWNTNSSGTGSNITAGTSFTPAASITLFARWTAITGIVLTQTNSSTIVNVTNGENGRVAVTVTAPFNRPITLQGTSGSSDETDPALYNGQGLGATRLAYQNNSYNFSYTIPAGQTVTVFAGTGGNVARSYTVSSSGW
jgi:uncharacterized repeat protein (TIGR02543 family)